MGPAPPLCGEGRIELQYDVNQSEFEQREDNVKSSWAPWPCPKKGPWPAPPLCGEGGVELQDLVNQSADVQKEDNVEFLNLREESNLPWPMQDLVNQSAEEDTVKLSWAPWPCPKKGPWPAPPLRGEGRIELQYDVNQSEFEQREDNVKSSWAPWPCPKKRPMASAAALWRRRRRAARLG